MVPLNTLHELLKYKIYQTHVHVSPRIYVVLDMTHI